MTKPNLFLLAPARSGTTQLAAWLSSHQDIGLPPVKEPNHFSQGDFPRSYVARTFLDDVAPAEKDWSKAKPAQFAVFRCEKAYLSLYAHIRTRYALDASTTYFPSVEAIRKIAQFNSSARFILLLRSPVDRSLSHFGLAHRIGQTRQSLLMELERELALLDPPGARFLVRPSVHSPALNAVSQLFPPEQSLILKYEDMIADPRASLASVARFLDIDAAGFDSSVSARNASVPPRYPALNRFLHSTGVKTFLRRTLPASIKPALKAIWFSNSGRVKISDKDRKVMQTLLALQ